MRGRPAQFALDLRCVNGVTTVVAGTVLDKRNQLARIAAELGNELVNGVANQLHNVQVRPFVVAADVVGLAQFAAREHQPERLVVVAHVKPVAHVQAVAINRHRLPRQDALDDHRDELFGKLIRAVVVRAIRDDRRQAVSMVIRPDDHVGRCLAGGIRRVRRVRRRLREKTGRAERTINFVGRDVVKAEAG